METRCFLLSSAVWPHEFQVPLRGFEVRVNTKRRVEVPPRLLPLLHLEVREPAVVEGPDVGGVVILGLRDELDRAGVVPATLSSRRASRRRSTLYIRSPACGGDETLR